MTIDECKLDILKQFQANTGSTQFTVSFAEYPEEYRVELYYFLQRHILLLETANLRYPN